MNSDDRTYLRRAIALARSRVGCASPNPPVGCVLVREGRIVGEGAHEYARRDHAEVVAVRAAGSGASGATAYVSLEPCSHHGRTPPCAELLVSSGIRRVVIPLLDPNPLVRGRGVERLRSAGIEVTAVRGFPEAAELIEPFACHVQTGLPLVVCKAGVSLDGRIAIRPGTRTAITSAAAGAYSRDLRLRMDAVLVGVGTVLSDDPELTYRGRKRKARPLVRVVLDSGLRTPVSIRMLREPAGAPVLIFCAPDAAAERRRELELHGAEVIAVPRGEQGLDLEAVLGTLGRREILGLLVEGGAEVHWSMLAGRHADKLCLLQAPVIFGGYSALPLAGGPGFDEVEAAARLKILRHRTCGPDLLIEAYPEFSRSILSPWRLEGTAPCDAPGLEGASGPR
jgi:diaminohydroxyphosphoribosylaminopyrimidine deaminase / 5-amino-6-(5-phosphoribosylamino)uracil reductase